MTFLHLRSGAGRARPLRSLASAPDTLALVCLGVSSVLVNVGLLAWFGIRHGADTGRYLLSASDLLTGRPFHGQGGWVYIGYNGLIAVCQASGVGELAVIGFHFLAAAFATLALYDIGRQIRGRLAGALAAGFFVVNYDIARWHLYVLTDSLYISLVVVATWLVHRAIGRGIRAYVGAVGVLVFTSLIRPNGWVLVPIAAIYWIARSGFSVRRKRAAAACVLLMCVGGAVSIAAIQFGRRPPQTRARPASGPERLPFSRVISLQDGFNLRRNANRLMVELLHVRTTFSTRHNAMVIAVIAVVYPLAVLGWVRSRRQPLTRLAAAVIACHLLVVAVTFSDRDGRYLLYVLPLIAVFAACGAVVVREERCASA